MRPADNTFAAKTDAEVWLTRKEAEILNGDWLNPEDGRTRFAEYAAAWINERPGLRPKTVQLCRYLLRCHLRPVRGPSGSPTGVLTSRPCQRFTPAPG